MQHIENNLIKQFKKMLVDLMQMVQEQNERAKECILNGDIEIVEEIRQFEKRINAQELSIDRECERFLAIYNPVASDLRFIISTLKTTIYLERLGDNSERIASYVEDLNEKYPKILLKKLQIDKMIDHVNQMLDLLQEAILNNDTLLARKAYQLDKKINKLNRENLEMINRILSENSKLTNEALHLFSTSKKIERSGDYCKHIAEELLFYMQAEIVHHKKVKKKDSKNSEE